MVGLQEGLFHVNTWKSLHLQRRLSLGILEFLQVLVATDSHASTDRNSIRVSTANSIANLSYIHDYSLELDFPWTDYKDSTPERPEVLLDWVKKSNDLHYCGSALGR